jgi:phage gp36-like protein
VSYAAQSDVQVAAGGLANLVSLTDQNGTGAIDLEVLARFQARADSTINGYLRLRYTTPLANPTEEVRDHAAALTVYYLREAKQMLTPHELEAHKARISWLEGVRDGKIRIDEPLPAKSTAVRSAIVPLAGDVTRENLKGMW